MLDVQALRRLGTQGQDAGVAARGEGCSCAHGVELFAGLARLRVPLDVTPPFAL